MLQQTPPKGPALVGVQPHEVAAPKPARDFTKLLIPLSVVAAVCVLVGVSSQRWDRWTAGADTQTTDNAYIRAELSRLSARVAGNVSAINVGDFDHVKAGDVLVEIDASDYLAKQAQAKAALDSALAQLGNLDNQKTLQKAAIRQAEAQSAVAKANAALAATEAERQVTLMSSGAGTQQKTEQAQAAVQSTAATALAAEAAVASAKAQLEYVEGQSDQLSANVDAARAALKAADLSVSYTKITAPFDGVVSERQVHVGDYVTVGTNSISIVPLPNVYMIANFKETQLARMKEGQFADVTVDALPGEAFKGHISRLSPASGSQFALLPADNATGNFTKVVQRVPVRIDFEASPSLERLRSGMSAVVSVSVASEGR
ncbi:hemolysin D [Pararhizobium polonicum]|uniref:Hemolysin D n=1 Tax=Pararhizobium polonicum TaxID=1612624 RepID=A0A1C7NXC1_9HYPH|nr:HlyD family secretion protein [Pararhizobium polonicum]OBZ92094.1 hemolysin D [Pararhizobium polonicum]